VEVATSLPVKDASAVAASPSPAVSVATVPHPILPPVSGGESIYRTIMNRLTALEANHTLYTRYVEQQNNGVRAILKGLAEDVGRLEGIVSLFIHNSEIGWGLCWISICRPEDISKAINEKSVNGNSSSDSYIWSIRNL